MYTRKTQDEYEVQGFYTTQCGWECVTAASTYKEAKLRLREYRENLPGVSFRVVKKRIRKEV
jgi:hypothetical protein